MFFNSPCKTPNGKGRSQTEHTRRPLTVCPCVRTHLCPDCSYAWGISVVSVAVTLQVYLSTVVSLVLTLQPCLALVLSKKLQFFNYISIYNFTITQLSIILKVGTFIKIFFLKQSMDLYQRRSLLRI